MSQKNQGALFESVNGNVTVHNRFLPDPPKVKQSKEPVLNARFEPHDKDALKDFCFEHNMTLSDCLRDSTRLFRAIYPDQDKLTKYWSVIKPLLDKLS